MKCDYIENFLDELCEKRATRTFFNMDAGFQMNVCNDHFEKLQMQWGEPQDIERCPICDEPLANHSEWCTP